MSFLSTPIIIIDHPLLLWTTPLIYNALHSSLRRLLGTHLLLILGSLSRLDAYLGTTLIRYRIVDIKTKPAAKIKR